MVYREALALLLVSVYTDSVFAFYVDNFHGRHGDHTRDSDKHPNHVDPNGTKPSLDCLLMADIITDFNEGDTSFFLGPESPSDFLGVELDDPKQLQKFACSLVEVTSLSELADLLPISTDVLESGYGQTMSGMVESNGGPLGVVKMLKSMGTAISSSFIDIFPHPQIPLQSNDDISLQDVETFIKRMVRNFGHLPFKDLPDFDEGPFIDDPESASQAIYESTSLEELAKRLDQPVEPFEELWSYFNEITSQMPLPIMKQYMKNMEPIPRFIELCYRLGLFELDI